MWWTYPKLGQAIPNFPDPLYGSPFEKPVWTKELDEKLGTDDFDSPFEVYLVPRRYFVVFPAYLIPETSGGDCHESEL